MTMHATWGVFFGKTIGLRGRGAGVGVVGGWVGCGVGGSVGGSIGGRSVGRVGLVLVGRWWWRCRCLPSWGCLRDGLPSWGEVQLVVVVLAWVAVVVTMASVVLLLVLVEVQIALLASTGGFTEWASGAPSSTA